MAFNFQASTVFSGTDQISQAVKKAQANTEKSAGRMGKSLDNTGKRADALKSAIGDVGKIAASVTIGNLITKGITAAATQIKSLVSSIGEYADRVDGIRTSALKTGLGVQEFQKLSWAAESNSVSVEKLQAGFTALNKSLGAGTLMKHLSETNSGLAAQVKQAKTNTEIFGLLSDAVKNESDIARRSALINAAFGKSGNELIPLLTTGSEAIKAAGENIPHIISEREIAAAKLWNSTLGEVKKNIRGFGDVMRNAIINAAGKYLFQLKDWINKNKEFIRQKIAEYVEKIAKGIKSAVTFAQKIVKFFKEWGKTILIIGGAVGVLWGIVSAITAIQGAITAVRAAMAILNVVLAANPVGLIVAAVALLILGFTVLSKKVGGFDKALTVAGQTMLKNVLAPLNAIVDAWQGMFWAMSHIPGADWAKTAYEKIGEYQGKVNKFLTGSESTYLESAVNGAVRGYQNGGISGAVKGGAGGAAGVFTESYDTHRAAYLAAHPSEAPGAKPADDADDNWEKALAKFDEMIRAQNGTTGAVADLKDRSNPLRPRWEAMGVDDYWETAKLGARP